MLDVNFVNFIHMSAFGMMIHSSIGSSKSPNWHVEIREVPRHWIAIDLHAVIGPNHLIDWEHGNKKANEVTTGMSMVLSNWVITPI